MRIPGILETIKKLGRKEGLKVLEAKDVSVDGYIAFVLVRQESPYGKEEFATFFYNHEFGKFLQPSIFTNEEDARKQFEKHF